jgi:helix-turn-helix protein
MPTTEPAYLTLSQVAVRTGRHPELLRQWCSSGRIPCARVGGSWVVREQDLPLVDAIPRRNRARSGVPLPEPSDRTRIIAAVFDEDAVADTVAATLRERLRSDGDAIGTTTLGLTALTPLRLSVVGGRFSEPASVDARRILVGYGGRIVADVDAAVAVDHDAELAHAGSGRGDGARRSGGPNRAR